MKVKDLHMMRLKQEEAKKSLKTKNKKQTPLAKEIEKRKEDFIRGILKHTEGIVNKQLEVASLPVAEDGKNNDTVLKATNSLLDRVFGKAKESVDVNTNVQFSLKDLAKRADLLEVDSEVLE